MNKKKVNIILPTYNGAKYISEQIESLLNQSYNNITIYIRDDGSSDRTKEIIKSYIGLEPDGKQIVLIEDNKNRKGYVKNVFDTLMYSEKADYYAFCDQDDVWLPQKIEKQVEMLESINDPALCFTSFYYCDENLNILKSSPEYQCSLNLKDVLFDFKVLNFNIMINHKLREAFFDHLPNNGEYPHYPDLWMSQIAACYENLYYVKEHQVLYRRNTGAASYFNKNKFTFLCWRIKNILFGKEAYYLRKELEYFDQCFGKALDQKNNQMIKTFMVPSVSHYFQKIFFPYRFRSSITDEVGLRMMFFLGKL